MIAQAVCIRIARISDLFYFFSCAKVYLNDSTIKFQISILIDP